ncbi:class I SAM-dependent methyltransferase [Anaerocolumna xylanovorans]|uniref:Methyltransferase domain-containing protein n=1 Tax=Anaerocolumna xylanovorans DSM 12503 TaxID=1121345 RepID=A0A1M7YIU4_9FIRM|nr:methyltransferase domain-containing protein [Anaerocolumna xylanovorans]SHO52530.1 Methyltransferase domain-containing protein [Anaerocolumna xylanovorans DSM 12503]
MDLRFTFNEDVLNYDRMRPTYVKELYEDIIQFSNLDSKKNALEIGIGTGQATLPFLSTGCKLTAVELGEDMAEFTKEKFAKFHNFDVIHSDFENVNLKNDNYDLIYSATAFHWIPQEVGYSKVLNFLKSGGVMALFWNHPSRTENELDFAMQEVYNKYRSIYNSTVHKFSEEKCLEIAETIRKYGFVDVEYKLYHQTRFFDAPQYMSLLNTYSDHRARQEETRILIESELSNAINNFGGKIDIKDTIDLYLARKP